MRAENILLIYPRPTIDKSPRFGFSVQLLQIAALLKREGYGTFFADYSYHGFSSEEFGELLIKKEINLCIIETDSFALKRSENIDNTLEILGVVSSYKRKSIAFGCGCILNKGREIPADIVIRGDPFKSVIGSVKSLLNGGAASESDYEFDDIPYPDRELLRSNEFFKRNCDSTLIKTSEGCQNSCTFCQRRGWQREYRAHSLEYVLGEFGLLCENGYKNVWITDENFTFDLNRAKELLHALIAEKLTVDMKIALSSWTRIDTEFLELAKSANVSVISFGIESADEEILEFYKKKIDLKATSSLFHYADKLGIYTVGNFIIGAPMETTDTIAKTFAYIEELSPDQVNIKILDYMEGSILYENLGRRDKSHYFACAENELNSFGIEELVSMKADFLRKYKCQKRERFFKKMQQFGLPYYPLR